MKKLLTLLGIFFLFILFPSTVLAEPIGKFTHIEGRVDLTSPGKAVRSAMLGDEVNVGDIIRTKSEAKAEITFVDGNILRLAKSTRMEITEYMFEKERTSGTLKLYRGKIQNNVKRILGRVFGFKKKNRFEVHTPTAVVGVRGTNFFTYFLGGISGASFKEGEGYCYSLNRPGELRNINKGQTMVVTDPALPPFIRESTPEEIQKHEGDTDPSTTVEGGDGESIGGLGTPSLFTLPTIFTPPPLALPPQLPPPVVVQPPPPVVGDAPPLPPPEPFDGPTYWIVSGTRYEGTWFNPGVGQTKVGWLNPNIFTPGRYYLNPYMDGKRYEYEYFPNGGRGWGWLDTYEQTGVDMGINRSKGYAATGDFFSASRNWNDPMWRVLERSTWDFDISTLGQSPGAGYYLIESETEDANGLAQTGTISGGIRSITGDLWAATEASPASMTLSGQYTGSSFPSLFGLEIKDRTPDGGAYIGFIGGYLNGIVGELTALYIKPDNSEAGVAFGEFSGERTSNTWAATGTIDTMAFTTNVGNVTADTLFDPQNRVRGIMDLDTSYGSFGGGTGNIHGGGFGYTDAIIGQDWGIFGLMHGMENFYDNPAGASTFTKVLGGYGEFGSYLTSSGNRIYDLGVWSAHVNNGTWANNQLFGSFLGKFITLLKVGELDGDILGTYTNPSSPGTWQAVSGGAWWKTQDLSFSSSFAERAYQFKLRDIGYKEYSNGSEYQYVYYQDLNRGYTKYIDQSSGKETHRVYYENGRYDEWVYNSSTKELLSFSTNSFNFNVDDPDNGVRNPASQGLNPGTPISSSGPYPDHRLRNYWEFEGIMGGLGNPWTATQASPASLVFGGWQDTWWSQGPTIFKADLRSYYPVTGAFTTPDGGAYFGLMGGVFENPVNGMFYTVYIGPNLDVGIHKASFNGNSWGDIWEASGSLYAIQLGSNSGIQPADLMGNIVQSSDWWNGENHNGAFVDNSDNPVGEIITWNRLREKASIPNQPFGISRVLFGGTYVEAGTYDRWVRAWDSWEDNNNMRRVGKHIGSQWSNNRIAAKGYHGWVDLARAVTGVAGSQLMGTFDPNKHTWQAVDMWAWVNTGKFYDLIATQAGRDKLAALNIPAFQIGNASTMGSNGNLDVYNDMKIFAYASGERPRIWTSTVSGNFTGGAPPIDSTVSLSGGGFNTTFQVKRWDNSKWGATIDGIGSFTRTDNSQSEDVNINGGAAGGYTGTTSGTFQGYGSGRADRYN